MKGKRVNVIGSGGHAKVVVSLLQDLGYEVAGVFDDNPDRWDAHVLGVPVRGPLEQLHDRPRLPAIIAVGDNSARRSIGERIDLEWLRVVHPHAHVDRSVQLGEGTVVMAGAVVQVEVVVGRHAIINTLASVDHDCVIGDFAHIAPGATLAGNVCVEDGVLIGAGAVAVPGVHVGRWTLVGAGATVVHDMPGEGVAKGVPARFAPRRKETGDL